MSFRRSRFPWPHVKDDNKKIVYYHIASGWPAVMMGPRRVEECFPGYEGHLCSHEKFQELQNEQKESN